MTAFDCRLISGASPFYPLLIEPAQEGIYSLFHAQVIDGAWTDPQALKERVGYAALGLVLLCPLIGKIALHILVYITTSYQEALRDAIEKGDEEKVTLYLKVGVNPNNFGDTKPLIYRTQNPKILKALIDHGADLRRSYDEQSFLEYLVENGFEELAVDYFDASYLEKEVYKNAIAKDDHRFAAFLIRMGAPFEEGRKTLHLDKVRTTNPLEPLVLKMDREGIHLLCWSVGIDKILEHEKALKKAFPKIRTEWMWQHLVRFLVLMEKESVAHDLVKNGTFEVGHFLTRDTFSSCLDQYKSFLIRMGYEGSKDEVASIQYQPYTHHPLETIIAMQNEKRLQAFIESRSFEEVYEAYLDLKRALPRINTHWIWNALYRIPPSHFTSAKELQKEEQLTEDPPELSSLSELTGLFERINFDHPTRPHYVAPLALRDTLDVVKDYTPTELKRGFRNIMDAIQKGKMVYSLTPTQQVGYHRQVQWILYYLKQSDEGGALSRDKANVLIEMAKTCLLCPGRYNEVFDAAIKRLKGDPIDVPTFEKQVDCRFADLRTRTITAIAYKEAGGCIHARENLVFHLFDSMAIVETKPEKIFSFRGLNGTEPEYYQFTDPFAAVSAFLKEYTPRALADALLECVREGKKRTQKENDFNELLFDAMIDAYAKRFPEIQALEAKMKERIGPKKCYEDQKLSKERVEEIFRPIDPEYSIPQEGLTLADYFTQFKKSFLAPKIRPLSDETYGYLLPEVIHPFVLVLLLKDMGHLEFRQPPTSYSARSFFAIPALGANSRM